jgi:hypothetical protein
VCRDGNASLSVMCPKVSKLYLTLLADDAYNNETIRSTIYARLTLTGSRSGAEGVTAWWPAPNPQSSP